MGWTGSAPSQVFQRTDGVRTGDDVFQQQEAAPVNITSVLLDAEATDMGDAINDCLKKDGGNTATADIPMGGFTLTNISDAGALQEPASFDDIRNNRGQYVATVGGTADAITLTPTVAITAYAAGQRFSFIASGDNTGAVTVNVSSVGAKSIKMNDGSSTALSVGTIQGNAVVDIEYDGTNFLLLNATGAVSTPAADDGAALGSTSLKWSDLFLASGSVVNFDSGDITVTHSANLLTFAGGNFAFAGLVSPNSNDAAGLGVGTVAWADLFLASGGVINWNNGDVTITHSSNALAFAGASSGYSFDAVVQPASSDGAALGSASVMWADLFLASGGVVNWNNGDVTVTHSANTLAFAGASAGYTFDALVSSTGVVTANSGTAVPANGNTGVGVKISSTANLGIFVGSGAPSLSAADGSIYLRTDAGQNAGLYFRRSGNWVAMQEA
jgi:hypothetical protein